MADAAALMSDLRGAAKTSQERAQQALREAGMSELVTCTYLGQRSSKHSGRFIDRPEQWEVPVGSWLSQVSVAFLWRFPLEVEIIQDVRVGHAKVRGVPTPCLQNMVLRAQLLQCAAAAATRWSSEACEECGVSFKCTYLFLSGVSESINV